MELCGSNGIIGINKSSINDGAISACESDFVFIWLDVIFSKKWVIFQETLSIYKTILSSYFW